jgi:3-methylcrotonyl-CoA carboxylase alpha subunit
LERLAFTCDSVLTAPVKNNAGFLAALLRDADVVAASFDTGFIAQKLDELVAGAALSNPVLEMGTINIFKLMGGSDAAIYSRKYGDEAEEPWGDLLGFRMNAAPKKDFWLLADGALRQSVIGSTPSGAGSLLWQTVDEVLIVDKGWPHQFKPGRTDGSHGGHGGDGAILAPMPGKVIAVEVAQGESVTKGQKLLTLEAMKMEHTLTAPFDGTVAELNATAGAQVQVEALLARIEAKGDEG